MKNTLWQAIYDVFTDIDAILNKAERYGTSPNMPVASLMMGAQAKPKAAGPSVGVAMRQAFVATDELVEVRSQIRAKLDVLKASFAEKLTEREGYLALFPLVVYFDEIVQNRFVRGQSAPWPPLQKELFKIDDGGALFYDTLDDLLRKPETLPFIYELFYFCLSDGFKGKHTENLAKINEYKHKLEDKIPHPHVTSAAAKEEAAHMISLERLPFSYYAAAAGAVAAVFAVFYGLASL
jgi:type IV/VI secretion system ImpK/VasF family protein